RSRSPERERTKHHDGASKHLRRHHLDTSERERDSKRNRSSSSTRYHAHQHHHRRRRRSSSHTHGTFYADQLPYSSRPLAKSDFEIFRSLFATYLEVQKNKYIGDMDEREVRGRWKSFVNKWNEGSLAEGWYNPEMFIKVSSNDMEELDELRGVSTPPLSGNKLNGNGNGSTVLNEEDGDNGNDDDDGYGPTLPISQGLSRFSGAARQGPGIPSLQDLELRREMMDEDRLEQVAQLRLERKVDRIQQKARLEELVPRAEPGTRERQLEKKKELNEKMKGFREGSPGAAEVNDAELLGGGDSVAELKRLKAASERKKTERELRREEIQRARIEEIEERRREYREKEDSTMAVFKELARQRFG
ncbi:uncharacterized protein BCR38DRAFT_325761, partial [Pseudomassariella vexata]